MTNDRDISADDIQWEPKPVHTRNADPALYLEALTREELLEWGFGAQDDIESLTFTLKRSLAALSDVMCERDDLKRRNRDLRDQIEGLMK